jgi:DNA-binding XRE family transcriptional regulator
MERRPVTPSTFTGLGQALRWLRERQTRKQYQVADLAGITKGMLSAYETGRQRPSLETLDKLLDTLGCDLNDLHNAIQIVNGRPEAIRRFAPPPIRPSVAGGGSAVAAGTGTSATLSGRLDTEPGGLVQPYPLRRRGATPPTLAGEAGGEAAGTGSEWEPNNSGRPADVAGCPDEIAEVPDPSELYRVLGHADRLPGAEERALAQMLDGFHQLIRYWDEALERLRRQRSQAANGSADSAH